MIEVKRIETGTEHDDAFMLMVEQFPELAGSTLEFYEYLLIAKKSNQVAGVIAVNKYIPKKAMLCAIVVKKELRGTGIALHLLKRMGMLLQRRGFTHLLGFTTKDNKAALNTFKRVNTNTDEQVIISSELEVSVPHIEQIEHRISMIKLKRNILRNGK